ncbi:hypothetical protein ACP70R_042191 [Stipagrostis hirtigluma subsp. patula]
MQVMSMETRYVRVASSGRFFLAAAGDDDGDRRCRHFLDACFLCKRDITSDRQVFMYRGDAAFCSDGCRQEQMPMDAALKAAARRQRLLLRRASSSAAATVVVMARRPTVAGLAAHASAVSAS